MRRPKIDARNVLFLTLVGILIALVVGAIVVFGTVLTTFGA